MLLQYMTLFYFECPQALGISRVDRWNNFYLSALTEYDKNWQEYPHAKFLLTRLLRGATETNRNIDSVKFISTHTPLARRDGVIWRTSEAILNFYSHASCEARLLMTSRSTIAFYISTHTPLARRDGELQIEDMGGQHFYSHASCEARHWKTWICAEWSEFLLTRLLRGATWKNASSYGERNFYSHAPCEARLH